MDINLEDEGEKPKYERKFEYRFKLLTRDEYTTLQISVQIPYIGCITEFTHRLISRFNLPIYLTDDLRSSLQEFIEKETAQYQTNLVSNIKTSAIDVEDVVRKWEKLYKEETVLYGEKRATSDSELFSNIYHKLVHSGSALQMMLQVEQSYGVAVTQLLKQREEQIRMLTEKQTTEMDNALETCSEEEINKLVLAQMEEQSLLQGRWNSEIDALKESQRKGYREWLVKLLEDLHVGSFPNSPAAPQVESHSIHAPVLEESFTIHLGSQMKQMHNIRIISADVLDFCRSESSAHLQTALGLYSNDLCGLVLLKDTNDLSSHLYKEFVSICESSTEFHFPSITDQLEALKVEVQGAVSWRKSTRHFGSLTAMEQESRKKNSRNLQAGDVFITRHSNLASVHVVFHMVVDDTIKSNDLSSRNPAILGLRNILKNACSNDVTTLMIPVLLTNEMKEDMTVARCTKRAELIFKCVKGFMIEMVSWGGSELKNLQFLIPKSISPEVFSSLANMLPNIFKVSNPLVFKESAMSFNSFQT